MKARLVVFGFLFITSVLFSQEYVLIDGYQSQNSITISKYSDYIKMIKDNKNLKIFTYTNEKDLNYSCFIFIYK